MMKKKLENKYITLDIKGFVFGNTKGEYLKSELWYRNMNEDRCVSRCTRVFMKDYDVRRDYVNIRMLGEERNNYGSIWYFKNIKID